MALASSISTQPTLSPATKPPSRKQRSVLGLWHLLSLDAPTIAALWVWFIAAADHMRLPLSSIAAMFLAVWMLYAADRLLDTRMLDSQSPQEQHLEARHYFHHRHRTGFLTGILLASAGLAPLLLRLSTGAIHLYLILGGLLFGYFILIHATRSAHRFPKEIAVGIFFAAATFIPTVAREPSLRLVLLPSALLLAMLCSLNCLFIYAWEHDPERPSAPDHPAHATTRFALRHLPLFAVAIAFAGTILSVLFHRAPWQIPLATAVSAALLLVLHHRRRRIAPLALRAAADLVLLTPLLLIPFLRR
ncbi:MAG TPA: hypothetical protein VMU57_09640 [Edaphobacter sp.]|uniref:hypothetical protein n=1 Tax=Edaphobacter sp. TaxID=1934404 RepID=UPI002C88AB98|nr:hypothetical protein [Edaphobacter sp.]HUZ95161.1 hypothetical protein [Edaphobacter sp.]